jgi:formamidopyrimidine-DNA glycosylase
MPELPEVETLRRDAERHLVGRRIADVQLLVPEVVRLPTPDVFGAALRGRAFEAARRRAKYLLLDLDDRATLAMQLALFGQLLLRDPVSASGRAGPGGPGGGSESGEALDPDTLLALNLDDGARIDVLDRSRYTRVYLGTAVDLAAALQFEKLGPEPLDPDFTAETLAGILRGRRARLKGVLLDQHEIAGLGNIYVDEALWRARLHPGRTAGSLITAETCALYESVRDVLDEAIGNRGTTFHTYRDLLGAKGQHQEHLAVFHRQGAPCPRCRTRVERINLASRDTHLCPTCQVLESDATGAAPGPARTKSGRKTPAQQP